MKNFNLKSKKIKDYTKNLIHKDKKEAFKSCENSLRVICRNLSQMSTEVVKYHVYTKRYFMLINL